MTRMEQAVLGPNWPVLPVAKGSDLESLVPALQLALTRWVIEAAACRHAPEAIARVLEEQGWSDAGPWVEEILASTVASVAVQSLQQQALANRVVQLRRTFENAWVPPSLSRDELSERRFLVEFWTAHRPLHLVDATRGWTPWSFEALRDRFAGTSVSVLRGRTGAWWRRRQELAEEMSFETLVDHALQHEGNDLYSDGPTGLLDRLPGLLDELGRLPGMAVDQPSASMWVGPRGTVTPTHHDRSAVWLIQRVGQKRVRLASPLEQGLWKTAIDGVHNTCSLGEVESDVRVHEILLEAGEAVFIPAGWWHEVEALTPSISVSTLHWQYPQDVSWYAASVTP